MWVHNQNCKEISMTMKHWGVGILILNYSFELHFSGLILVFGTFYTCDIIWLIRISSYLVHTANKWVNSVLSIVYEPEITSKSKLPAHSFRKRKMEFSFTVTNTHITICFCTKALHQLQLFSKSRSLWCRRRSTPISRATSKSQVW